MTQEQAQILQTIAEAIAALFAGVALFEGSRQYKRSEQWKRAEFVAELVRKFEAQLSVQQAMTALDWSSRRIDLLDTKSVDRKEWVKVTTDLCIAALRAPDPKKRFSPAEVRLRECFDELFAELDRFEVFIARGLVSADEVKPYLIYWLSIIGDPNNSTKSRELQHAMWRFIDRYGYDGMQRLCRRFGYHIQPPIQLLPGDIFFTRGQHWLSRAIRFFSRSIGESRAKVNHVGLVVAPGWMKNERQDQDAGLTKDGEPEAVVVEALSRVKEHKLASQYLDNSTEVAVYRPVGLSPENLTKVVAWAKEQKDNPYGWGRIIGHFLDWFLLGAYAFRRLFRGARYPICSFLVAEAYAKVDGGFFGTPADAASPDDLWDCVTALTNGSRFECVRDLALMRD